MPHLIIGHTTDTSAVIWVRGGRRHRRCRVSLEPAPSAPAIVELSPDTDFTAVVPVPSLDPSTTYEVTAEFPSHDPVRGRFRTPPASADGRYEFSFILSSCNLSVVSINNLAASLLAAAGTAAGVSSLDLDAERWKCPGWIALRRFSRWSLRWILKIVAFLIARATGLKQPPPPYFRSPFLKLSAVFDAHVIEVTAALLPDVEPPEVDPKGRPSVGDRVATPEGAGVVACLPTSYEQASCKVWRLVVTHIEGEFRPGHRLCAGAESGTPLEIGTIVTSSPAIPWFETPSFFIHAGDQIYYDFPSFNRAPNRDEYREAYREAWFDDDGLRHLLSHWPQYMTLDDHEVIDQFALDFKPPGQQKRESSPEQYLTEAMVAYDEYVQSRHPTGNGPPRGGAPSRSRWYAFDRGASRFFVLDTRTERRIGDGQLIDTAQMAALFEWLTDNREDLKFVVTSVPFIAEVKDELPKGVMKWAPPRKPVKPVNPVKPVKPDNPSNDTWSGREFRRQRHQIIEYLAQHAIDRLVFLTGDMHCCYHATMHIAAPSGLKYEGLVVHELAGGPANQLQLARIDEFHRRRVSRTRDDEETGVAYEVVLERFHSEVNAVLHIGARYVERDVFTGRDDVHGQAGERGLVPEVEWHVIRTLTDNGPRDWLSRCEMKRFESDRKRDSSIEPPRMGEPVMSGRIAFTTRRVHPQCGPSRRDALQVW